MGWTDLGISDPAELDLIPRYAQSELCTTSGTPCGLHTASFNGNKGIFDILLETQTEYINLRWPAPSSGGTPLHLAAMEGHEEIVRVLVERGADANTTYNSISPLHDALMRGRHSSARVLLELGANATLKMKQECGGKSPLILAAQYSLNTDVIHLLLGKGADADIDATEMNGRSALFFAIGRGNAETVRVLLERGADVYCKCKDRSQVEWGSIPLHYAAVLGHEAIVRQLLERDDIDINSKNNDGKTPLKLVQDGIEKYFVAIKDDWYYVAEFGHSKPYLPALHAVAKLLQERGGI
jgi:ankyrin repeat protein